MAFEITSLAWRESPDTQASARVARCQTSWWSTSATEISKRRRRVSLRPLRACRLPLSEPTSGRCSSTVPTATRAPATGPAPLQRAGDLFGGERLDHVVGRHPLDAFDADAALEALQHLAHVVLEPLERGDARLAQHGVAALDAGLRPAHDLALGDRGAVDRAH